MACLTNHVVAPAFLSAKIADKPRVQAVLTDPPRASLASRKRPPLRETVVTHATTVLVMIMITLLPLAVLSRLKTWIRKH